MEILPRRPSHPDVTQIPTPPLQAWGLFINFFFPAVALIAMCLRAYVRIKIRQWGIDDYLLAMAMLFSLLMTGPFYMYIKLNYYGWHQEDVPVDFDATPGKWWFYLAQLFYNPVLAFVRASILVFLLRLGGQKTGVRWAIIGLLTFNGLQAVAIFLVATLQCLPIKANWDPKAYATARCVDNSFHITLSSLNILTDLLVLALPFWIFLGLKMPKAAKTGVIFLFMIGLSVTIIAVFRLVELIKLFYVIDPHKDRFHTIAITLSVVEVNLAITTACGPALRPLFHKWFPGLFGGSRASKNDNPYANVPTFGGTSHSGVHHRETTSHLGNGPNSIALKSIRVGTRAQHTECRSVSPTGSEEEIMTYNGIVRTTDVRVQYDGDNISQSSSDFKHAKEEKPAAL